MQENIRENNTGRQSRKGQGMPEEDGEEGQNMGKAIARKSGKNGPSD